MNLEEHIKELRESIEKLQKTRDSLENLGEKKELDDSISRMQEEYTMLLKKYTTYTSIKYETL